MTRRSWTVAPYLFLAPALGLLTVFFVLPVLAALLMSFTDLDIYAIGEPSTMRWVGLSNYKVLITSPVFWRALKNTSYFVVLAVPLSIGTSLAAALALNSKAVFLKPLFRLGFFAPVVTTLVAVAVVWRYLYHPSYGLLNWALGHVGIAPQDWLGDPLWAMPALVLLAVWKNFGYNMMIFLAALQGIPADLSEAARIDGASKVQEFWSITLPQLWPTTTFVTLMTLIGYFQFFAEPYVMTNGGPLDQTVSVVMLMYREGFRYWRMGYAAAVAFALFAIVIVITLLAMRARRAEAT